MTPSPLLFTRQPFSSTRKNARSPATPPSVSSHSPTCRSARPLTGAREIQAMRALTARTLAGQEAFAVPRRPRAREPRVRDRAVLRLLRRARVVARRDFVDTVIAPRAVLLELPRADAEEDERPLAGARERVLRLRRAVHEVPLPQRPFLALHDQDALAGEHEEVFLLGFPVVGRARLARAEHADAQAEHREERLRLVLSGASQRQAEPLAGFLEPASVAGVEDEPAFGRGHEAGLRLLEPRLADHAAGA